MRRNNFSADFINHLPKAELHLHIEGTFEPELMFEIARRNGRKIKCSSAEKLRRAYNFRNLQDFLDIYYESASVLIKERDFYDLTWAYLKKAHSQGIIHTEIFFDPQTHTGRGIKFSTVVNGISRALRDAQTKLEISTKLIMCFLRHLSEEAAEETLRQALDYENLICAVGLDSSEVGHPPSKFRRVFEKARRAGFLTVAHAGEEGSAEYIWEALKLLKISRLDHGNRSLDDKKLTGELVHRRIPLTLCPLSNLKLRVIDKMESHPLKKMMKAGLMVTVNSDDPAYFGGYLNENYLAVTKALKLSKEEICRLAENSLTASFLEEKEKKAKIGQLRKYCTG